MLFGALTLLWSQPAVSVPVWAFGTTVDGRRKHLKKDAAPERRFALLPVGETTVDDTVEILPAVGVYEAVAHTWVSIVMSAFVRRSAKRC
ncbi:hypothetical protein KYY02_24610 [Streptomyces pimonensis]|uniref:Secreted protein n=1 Tax=Streptomyces pimonensis TaxID=2860288 RepID=A0ABV4J490_9ACTN